MRRLFGRHHWNFPSFSPDRVDSLVLRTGADGLPMAGIVQWAVLGHFDLTFTVTVSLRNERIGGFFLSKRLNVRFKDATQRFFIREGGVCESTVSLRIAGGPSLAERFRATEPIIIESRRDTEKFLLLEHYRFSRVEVPKPPPPDPDGIPF